MEQISELYGALQATEPTQQKITGSLDYVEAQQKELGLILDQYENSVNEILGNDAQLSGMGGADGERERAYVAEPCMLRLRLMMREQVQPGEFAKHSAGRHVSIAVVAHSRRQRALHLSRLDGCRRGVS